MNKRPRSIAEADKMTRRYQKNQTAKGWIGLWIGNAIAGGCIAVAKQWYWNQQRKGGRR